MQEKLWTLIGSSDLENVVMGLELLEGLELELENVLETLKIPSDVSDPQSLFNWSASFFAHDRYIYLWVLGYLASKHVSWVIEIKRLRLSMRTKGVSYLSAHLPPSLREPPPDATVFPDVFSNLPLEELDLSHNYLIELPNVIRTMPIKKLSLSHNLFQRLSFKSSDFPVLEELDVSYCERPLQIVFEAGAFPRLKKLSLYSSNIRRLPDGIASFSQLESLDLSCEPPQWITDLVRMTVEEQRMLSQGSTFNPSWTSGMSSRGSRVDSTLSDISALSACHNLRVLRLRHHKIENVDDTLISLKKLVDLDLSFNAIKTLQIPELPDLEYLRVAGNPLGDSLTIQNTPKLTFVDLTDIGLSDLPNGIASMSRLSHLLLGENEMVSIEPTHFANQALEYVSLWGNQLSSAELEKLPMRLIRLNETVLLSQRYRAALKALRYSAFDAFESKEEAWLDYIKDIKLFTILALIFLLPAALIWLWIGLGWTVWILGGIPLLAYGTVVVMGTQQYFINRKRCEEDKAMEGAIGKTQVDVLMNSDLKGKHSGLMVIEEAFNSEKRQYRDSLPSYERGIHPPFQIIMSEAVFEPRYAQIDNAGKLYRYRNGQKSPLKEAELLEFGRWVAIEGNAQNFEGIQKLDFQSTRLKEVPEFIQHFPNLKIIDLSFNPIERLPEWLGDCGLKRIVVNGSNIQTIPMSIVQRCPNFSVSAKKISSTLIRGNRISRTDFNLKAFAVICQRAKDEPDFAGQFTHFDFEDSELSELPAGIVYLTALERLNLSGTQLSVLPEGLTQLTRLRELNVQRTQIRQFPTGLSAIGVDEVQWPILEAQLSTMTGLKGLKVRAGLKAWPSSILALTELEILDLRDNQLSDFSEGLLQCHQLNKLILMRNAISELPDEFVSLTRLELIDLSRNQISELSDAWLNQDHCRLNLDRNPITKK